MSGKLSQGIFLILLVIICFTFSGCAWSLLYDILNGGCDVTSDPHCFQNEAVASSDGSGCENVKAPPEWAKLGTDPPKDKCYLEIAENTGDYSYCSKMQGGTGGYEPSECYTSLAVDKLDPSGCDKMTGKLKTDCLAEIGTKVTPDTIATMDQQLADIRKRLVDDPQDASAQAELNNLQARKDSLFNLMPADKQSAYRKERFGAIIDDVSDPDVKLAIMTEFNRLKLQHPDASIDKQAALLEDVKKQQEFAKRADDAANQLVDLLKDKANDYANDKKQELIDSATSAGWDWTKEQAGKDMQYYLNELEDMKGKYDKASEQYDKISKQYDKLKKTYDEIMSVKKKVDEVNKLMAEGKITEGQANVIKGAVYLGKGLEYATSYVPVFGSTVSTISKETFQMTVELAKKRAQRTTALNACIDDPEHCDPNSISGY